MREIVRTSQFKSDLKRLAKSGKYSIDELLSVIEKLANDISLFAKYHNHPLAGKWKDNRDCHIRPDWLLIYRLDTKTLTLVRTGSHAELFG